MQVTDPAGREWSLATVQLDFHQPAQFDLGYVGPDGRRDRPVLVHRSLVGSMERLFGHLIEVHGGAFPVWCAPVQVMVLPVGANQSTVADSFAADTIRAGLRVEVRHDGSVGARIRAAAERKVPYVAVIGAREAAEELVALRLRDGRELPPQPAAAAIELITAVIAERSGSLYSLLPAAATEAPGTA